MARIRTIKPEFFTSEDIVALSPLARLLYIALWCEADREGRLMWKPRTFKMRYFPADDCDIEVLCAELITAKLVKLYGDGFGVIPKFGVHQHLNPREAASALPDPNACATRAPRVNDASAREKAPSVTRREEGKGREGNVEDASALTSDTLEEISPPPVVLIPLVDGSDHGITASKVAEWSSSFPAVNVLQQIRQMREWCNAKPARRKTRRGVEAFVVGWLSRAQDRGGVGLPSSSESDIFAGAK
jgi:hypothetical protein